MGIIQRKGQVTLFILLGIFFFLFIALVYYSGTEKVRGVQTTSSKESVNAFVQSCLDTVLSSGIPFLAAQGGYWDVFHAETAYLSQIPYYFYFRTNTAPSKEIVEEEFEMYLTENFLPCIDNFTAVEYLEIQQEAPAFDVTIESEKIYTSLTFPLTIREDDSVTTLDSFTSEQETRFGTLLSIAQAVAEEQEQQRNAIPLSFIAEQAQEHAITFDVSYDLRNTAQISLIDETEDLRFVFALHYDWDEEE